MIRYHNQMAGIEYKPKSLRQITYRLSSHQDFEGDNDGAPVLTTETS